MKKTKPQIWMSWELATLLSILVLFIVVYLIAIFPFAYFRHDDWLMLGNGVLRLPEDWKFAFSPTWYVNNAPEVWFFRPFFKYATLIFYNLFGYEYKFWITATLLIAVGAIGFGAATVKMVTGSTGKALLFTLLFIASTHLHFGNIIWMGEGLMNSPQMFLLLFNTYLFTKSALVKNKAKEYFLQFLAFFLFLLSLGFKEAAIFHLLFLFAFILTEAPFKKLTLLQKALRLLPYGVFGGSYLIYRLFYLPINEGYIPHVGGEDFWYSIIMLSTLAVPLIILLFFLRAQNKDFSINTSSRLRLLYLPFLILVICPYIGHPFFSPGWLFAPGMYLILILSLSLKPIHLNPRFFIALAFSSLTFTLIPVGWKLDKFGWWDWHEPQRQIQSIFEAQSDKNISNVVIFSCANPDYPEATMERVVGSLDGLSEIWALKNGKRVPMQFKHCSQYLKPSTDPTQLKIQWKFPKFTVGENSF